MIKVKRGTYFTYYIDKPGKRRIFRCRFCEETINEDSFIQVLLKNHRVSVPFRCCPKEECRTLARLIDYDEI